MFFGVAVCISYYVFIARNGL